MYVKLSLVDNGRSRSARRDTLYVRGYPDVVAVPIWTSEMQCTDYYCMW